MSLPPKAQALKDYKGGGGQDDDPYPRGSAESDEYSWEMHRLWHVAFQTSRQQDLVEGKWNSI